jgi:hypothetical protein
MTKIIVTANVKDPEAWEAGFRTMSALLNTMYISPINLGIRTDDNSFAFTADVKDVDQFLSMINSEKIKNAQKENGVIDGTVRYYVLDKICEF